MAPRKLSPSVLAALGLSACVDGCDPEDLPIVGRLFEEDGGDTQACLNVPAPQPPPIEVPPEDVGPCLEIAMDTGTNPKPTPAPVPEDVQPCLLIVMPAPVTQPTPVGPCLKVVQPQRVQPERVGPCLRMRPISPPPQPTPAPATPDNDGAGALEAGSTSGEQVLAALIRDGVLAEDVVARISDSKS